MDLKELQVDRDERDYLAHRGRTLIAEAGEVLTNTEDESGNLREATRDVTVMGQLMTDIGWDLTADEDRTFLVGPFLPPKQLLPWLERFRMADAASLAAAERELEVILIKLDGDPLGEGWQMLSSEARAREAVAIAQETLATCVAIIAKIRRASEEDREAAPCPGA